MYLNVEKFKKQGKIYFTIILFKKLDYNIIK